MEDLASEEEGAAIDRPCKSALVSTTCGKGMQVRGIGGVLGETKPQSSNKKMKKFSSHSNFPAPSKNHP